MLYSIFYLTLHLVNYLDFSQDKIDHSIQTTVYKYRDFVEYNVLIFMKLFLSANVHQGKTFLVCNFEACNLPSVVYFTWYTKITDNFSYYGGTCGAVVTTVEARAQAQTGPPLKVLN